MALLEWFRNPGPPALPPDWILVPLGNPGDAYAHTRHNLGRLLLQRWAARQAVPPERLLHLPSGELYRLPGRLLALVPDTYMNLSGAACAEVCALGIPPERLILLHDDKDLPLGLGRFRTGGSSGGHNGLASVFERLGTQDVARLRLGIGPIQRPLHDFVLGPWTGEEWPLLERLDAPFGRFLKILATVRDLANLPTRVNGEAFWRAADLAEAGPASTIPASEDQGPGQEAGGGQTQHDDHRRGAAMKQVQQGDGPEREAAHQRDG